MANFSANFSAMAVLSAAIVTHRWDFKQQKTQPEEEILKRGHICIFLPKFHPETNPIEYYWGNKGVPKEEMWVYPECAPRNNSYPQEEAEFIHCNRGAARLGSEIPSPRIKPPFHDEDEDSPDWDYDFIFGTTMLNTLKENGAVSQMNDHITSILAINVYVPEDIKTAYEKAAKNPPRPRVSHRINFKGKE
ncbi:hypothetical protein FN846DRAFT_1007167 [Sphaerosporella brunnea]|uniref:Uncharacterized protein n=1 Tax=Sphaerosporella brunnea TaxID=1250544 RepID=A0A5J5F2Q3_9PEZI|nr:hypothetical protein FN846DRAFT_1007167 [Sphaerosporella brunnea]